MQAYSRKALRAHHRHLRNELSQTQQQAASQAWFKLIQQHPLLLNAKRVASYLPSDGELDVTPLMHFLAATNRELYLPVLHPKNTTEMGFVQHHANGKLCRNRFNIEEPAASLEDWVDPRSLDLVIMPLVAFDEKGSRLGMGGGFYDRAFSFLRLSDDNITHHTKLLAAAHHCQLSQSRLPHEEWDVPLDAAITDQQIFTFV